MAKHPLRTILLICMLVFGVVACGNSNTGALNQTQTSTPSAPAAPSPTATISPSQSVTPVPPQVTGVALSVSPGSFSSINCGNTTDIVFTAVITISPGSTGGSLPYSWHIDNSTISGSVSFAAGQTSQTVSHTLSSFTAQLNTVSSVAGSITVGNPGASMSSSTIRPNGLCNLPGPFQVVGIAISVNPSSIAKMPCGTTLNLIFTATVTIASDSNGGTVRLTWNILNFHPLASLTFGPAQTVQTVSYTQGGTLVHNNSNGFPRSVSITSTYPNTVSSASIKPPGICK